MNGDWHESGAVGAYVAGRLAPDELEAFEAHLLDCAECRANVRLGAAARIALLSPAPRLTAFRRGTLLGGIGLAAAIVLAMVGQREYHRITLGRAAPPAFVGADVRSAAASSGRAGTAQVDRGMAAYVAGDYRRAATLLALAAQSDSSPGVAFYLGAAQLSAGDASAALTALLRARTPAGNAYANDATLLAAKALVQLRRPDSAVALLRGAAPLGSAGAALRAFADSIERP
jgi:hypothetical protein